MPGWQTSLCEMKSLDEMPDEARSYIDRMSELADCDIWGVSVGPARDQTIIL
jgi:adenylosuccinate synthase